MQNSKFQYNLVGGKINGGCEKLLGIDNRRGQNNRGEGPSQNHSKRGDGLALVKTLCQRIRKSMIIQVNLEKIAHANYKMNYK